MKKSPRSIWNARNAVILGIIILIAAVIWTFTRGNVTGNVAQENVITAEDLIDNDASLGDADASVTVVEFTDFQCPFCRKFETDVFPQIKTDYIDTGKVRWITRDFPLENIHPNALSAAVAAECVRLTTGDADYYQFKHILVQKQNERDSGSAEGVTKAVPFTNEDLTLWARSQGYDIEDCLARQPYVDEVHADYAEGQQAGVRGTPAFFIIDASGNYVLISGVQPYPAFKSALDYALSN